MYSKTYVGRQVLVILETRWLPQNEQNWIKKKQQQQQQTH